MTKRLHYTLEEVIDDLSDDEDDYDDPDEPMVEGSDDEFSDLEMDGRDKDLYDQVDLSRLPGSSTPSSAQPNSPTSTLSPPGSPSQSPSPSNTPSSASSSPGKYTATFVLKNLFISVCEVCAVFSKYSSQHLICQPILAYVTSFT